MSRLRRVIRQYNETGNDILLDDQPIDIDEQNEIIREFEQSLPLQPSGDDTPRDKLILKFLWSLEFGLVAANFVLIAMPYYRKDNPVFSFMSCSSILLSAVLLMVEFIHYQTRRQLLQNVPNSWLMIGNIVFSSVIALAKVPSFALPPDVLFLFPLLVSLTVYSSYWDREDLSFQIEKLKGARYHYKDA